MTVCDSFDLFKFNIFTWPSPRTMVFNHLSQLKNKQICMLTVQSHKMFAKCSTHSSENGHIAIICTFHTWQSSGHTAHSTLYTWWVCIHIFIYQSVATSVCILKSLKLHKAYELLQTLIYYMFASRWSTVKARRHAINQFACARIFLFAHGWMGEWQ